MGASTGLSVDFTGAGSIIGVEGFEGAGGGVDGGGSIPAGPDRLGKNGFPAALELGTMRSTGLEPGETGGGGVSRRSDGMPEPGKLGLEA